MGGKTFLPFKNQPSNEAKGKKLKAELHFKSVLFMKSLFRVVGYDDLFIIHRTVYNYHFSPLSYMTQ